MTQTQSCDYVLLQLGHKYALSNNPPHIRSRVRPLHPSKILQNLLQNLQQNL